MQVDWKKSHYTTTYKVRLYTNNIEYLKLTNEIYNDLIKKYFDILYERQELLELSSFKCLSELERLTLIPKTGARKGEIPELYFEQDAPLYLRRAAINQAIGNAKIQIASERISEENNNKIPSIPEKFSNSTTFYKGMYKNLEGNSISLKLFDGEEWKWFKAKLEKFEIPENAEILSPTIVIHKDYIMAHIPVKHAIDDVTPIKLRMQESDIRVCGIVFPNSDTDAFAVCVAVDGKGKFIKSLFIKGANEYKYRIEKILSNMEKNRQENQNYTENDYKNKKEKIGKIKNYYAHKVSKQIVDFCKENQVQVIAKANYEKIKEKTEDVILFYETKHNRRNPVGLTKKILKNLQYKAYKEGILITGVVAASITNRCYKCGGYVRRKIQKTDFTLKLRCENGHTGDYYFNGAMNVAHRCLKKFGHKVEIDDK